MGIYCTWGPWGPISPQAPGQRSGSCPWLSPRSSNLPLSPRRVHLGGEGQRPNLSQAVQEEGLSMLEAEQVQGEPPARCPCPGTAAPRGTRPVPDPSWCGAMVGLGSEGISLRVLGVIF